MRTRRAGVSGIRLPAYVPTALELVNEEARGLLGDLGLLGEVREPGAVRTDAGEQPGLSDCDVVEASGPHGRCPVPGCASWSCA
jgi:hypothetical protein